MRGINGVPAVVVEGKWLISGGHPAGVFAEALRGMAGRGEVLAFFSSPDSKSVRLAPMVHRCGNQPHSGRKQTKKGQC
jgi:hypothetical protein